MELLEAVAHALTVIPPDRVPLFLAQRGGGDRGSTLTLFVAQLGNARDEVRGVRRQTT